MLSPHQIPSGWCLEILFEGNSGSELIHVTANEITMKEERSQMLALTAKEQTLE